MKKPSRHAAVIKCLEDEAGALLRSAREEEIIVTASVKDKRDRAAKLIAAVEKLRTP